MLRASSLAVLWISERSHRIDDHEFYQLLDRNGVSDDIHLFNEKLREWEDYYNYHRPHGGLETLQIRTADPRITNGMDQSYLTIFINPIREASVASR